MSSLTGPPANKKRALTSGLETSFTHYLEASSYKTDLEYERSMRARDQRTAQAEHERLTKLLEFAQGEAERYQQLLHDERNEADIHAERLTQARDDAIVELRRLQEQQYENDNGGHDANAKLWQRKIRLLQDQVLSKDGALDELKIQLAGVQQELRDTLAAHDEKKRPSTPPPMAPPVGAVSPAPAELLQELNRIRIQLAETERSERQWQRKANTLQDLVAQQLVPEQETSRRLQLRNAELERQVKELRGQHETVQAEHVEYKTLAEELQQTLLSVDDGANTNTINPHSIVRRVQELKSQCTQAQESNTRLEQRVEQLKNWKGPMDVKLQQLEAKEQQWNMTKKQLQEELETHQGQVTTLKRTQAILQREIASLQEINASLDSLEQDSHSGVTTISLQQKLSAARVELQSSQEAHATLKADRDRIQTALEKALEETKEGTQELTRVKEKYGKLREALELQKQAAAEAEQRAVRAEELAGKGSFNPNTTRVVHLSHNPLTTTLKEQNATLKQQLQEANQKLTKSGDKAVTTSSSSKEVDPNKLHQRLKQQFRDQIGLFREGVHLITGYKIDMLPNQKRTRFRVRSMYAAHESDELVFEWPKKGNDGKEDAPVTTLHCMNTEWAKKLARETSSSSMEYMTKYNSIPAFVASVQLAEFEKQTLMG